MKTTKSLLISLLFIPVLAFAHEPVALPNAGLTPESAFYFVDKIGEALREFFTSTRRAKRISRLILPPSVSPRLRLFWKRKV